MMRTDTEGGVCCSAVRFSPATAPTSRRHDSWDWPTLAGGPFMETLADPVTRAWDRRTRCNTTTSEVQEQCFGLVRGSARAAKQGALLPEHPRRARHCAPEEVAGSHPSLWPTRTMSDIVQAVEALPSHQQTAVLDETSEWDADDTATSMRHSHEPLDDSTANGETRLDRGCRTTSARSSAGSVYDELAEVTVAEIWAGVDTGKTHRHTVVINAEGEQFLSRRILNDETELLALMGDVLAISDDVLGAVDLNHGGAALIGLLIARTQPVATSLAWRSTGPRPPIGARERPTRRTPSSAPTRPASAGIWGCSGR
jgi:hypothetical protein